MADQLVSIAIMEPFEGREHEFLGTLRELYALMQRKGYSHDELFNNRNNPQQFCNVRHWTSEAARHDAHEDPEVHRFWAQLGNLCLMRAVYESLEGIDWRSAAGLHD